MVKKVRVSMVQEAGYADIFVEPRTNLVRDQRRADIFYVDRTGHKHVHYYTDDCVAHPLSKTHIACIDHPFNPEHCHGEAEDPTTAMGKMETKKADSYASQLLAARTHPSVLCGLRAINYKTCSFNSLGAYGKGTTKCINGAAGFMKKRLVAEARLVPRADGKQPQDVSGRFRFMSRAKLQVALMRGNGLLANLVGL